MTMSATVTQRNSRSSSGTDSNGAGGAAELLNTMTRRLSMVDDELPSPSTLSVAVTPPPSPFVARDTSSPGDPKVGAKAEGGSPSIQDKSAPASGGIRAKSAGSGSSTDSASDCSGGTKRNAPSAQRTNSDAADIARRRLSIDGALQKSLSKDSRKHPPLPRHSTIPESASPIPSRTQHPRPVRESSPAGGSQGLPEFHPDEGDSDEDLPAPDAAVVDPAWQSGLTSWASMALMDSKPVMQRTPSKPYLRVPMAAPVVKAPRIFWGKAQAQGDREHFEDRLTIQPEYVPHAEEEDGSNPTPTGNPAAPAAPGATTTSTAAQPAARPAAGSDKAERCSYAGVFDGHSAADAAQTAAQRLHVLLAGELGSCTRDTSGHLNPTAVEAALCRSFAAMDFEILADAARTGARSGSTACVVLQLGGHLYCAHAGDSIAVLARNGVPELLSTGNHKVDDPEEARRIVAKGGRLIEGGSRIVSPTGRHTLNMSRALGDGDYKSPHRLVSSRPDVKHVDLKLSDTAVIIATDGLWDVVSEADAVSIVNNALESNAELKAAARGHAVGNLADAAAEALVRAAERLHSKDNVTALVGLVRWGE